MLGVARRSSIVSTGWWVGPSSPSPIESWVITNNTPNLDRALFGRVMFRVIGL